LKREDKKVLRALYSKRRKYIYYNICSQKV
jgi:hypothetical protein